MDKITVLTEGFLVLAMGLLSLVDGIRLNESKSALLYDVLGPGNYNFGIGLMLIIVGLIYLIMSYPRKQIAGGKVQEKRESRKSTVLIILFVLGGYIFLINIVGYLLATLAFFFVVQRILGFKSWLISAGLSIAISGFFYIIFMHLLNMPLPRGVLFRY